MASKATKKVNPVPNGMRTVTPSMTIRNCAKAIEFYERALGAERKEVFPSPDGKSVWHAELKVGDSIIFMNDEMPGMTGPAPSADKPSPVSIWLYVKDCDAAFKRAVAAGANGKYPPGDMFWGDRCGGVLDPFGYNWTFATHVKDMTREEMVRGGEEFAKAQAAGKK
jgi:PhnB protein